MKGVQGEMKGLSLRNYPVVLAELRGPEVAERMRSLLPGELQQLMASGGIVASGWYPVAWKCALHEAGRRATGEARLAWTMGAEMTRRDLQGIYRRFVRIVSPRYVLSLAAQLFSTYLRPGRMRVLEAHRGFVRVWFEDCIGFSRDMWQDVLGGCEAALEIAGARAVRIRIESGARDGDETAQGVAWWGDAG
jgi:hypothetical protein